MSARLNLRLLGWTLLAALVLAAAGGAALWYLNRPEHLYASAQRYFDLAEAARARSDSAAARTAYQAADNQLRNLLDPDKAPDHGPGLLLRHKVLRQLAVLAAASEKEDQPADQRPSVRLASEAKRVAFLAAADPARLEAQALALDYCFRDDALGKAVPYARNLLERQGEANTLPHLPDYLDGAYYILAREAVVADPPRPDRALELLRASRALRERESKEPRWRALGLEVYALSLKIQQLRDTPRLRTAPSPDSESDPVAEWTATYRRRLDYGLDRVKLAKNTPAAAGERPALALTSLTDVRGLFDFLTLAATASTDRGQALARLQILLDAGETVAAPDADAAIMRETARLAAATLKLVDGLSPVVRPTPSDRLPLNHRIEGLLSRAAEAGAAVDRAAFLRLAELARAADTPAESLRLALKGLEPGKAPHRSADHAVELELHSLAAWMLLVAGKESQAEEHLVLLRADPRFAPTAALIQGLAAVVDGRLERGVADLVQARQNSQIDHSVYVHLGLAHGLLGLGRHAQALEELDRLEPFFNRLDRLSAEDRALAGRLLPNADSYRLERLRCHLGLGRFDLAETDRESFHDRPAGVSADLLVIDALLHAGRNRLDAAKPDEARACFSRADDLIAVDRRTFPDELGFVNAAAESVIAQHGVDAPKRAAEIISAFAAGSKQLDAQILWARWLDFLGRGDEARALLTDLAARANKDRRPDVQAELARLEWRRGRLTEAAKLARELEPSHADMSPLAADLGDDARATAFRLEAHFGLHGRNGRLNLLRAEAAEQRADYAQAAWSYERALDYTAWRPAARAGLLASLMTLAEKDPRAAADLSNKFLVAHPEDPALLLGHAEAARRLDEVFGPKGMESDLAAVKLVLARHGSEAVGDYLAAAWWQTAGRPDLARREAEAGLASDPANQTIRLLAARLAAQAEDWDACLTHTHALVASPTSDLSEIDLLRAASLAGLGKLDEARTVYRNLIMRQPRALTAYLGLASLHEAAGDLPEATTWIEKVHDLYPADLEILRQHIRLLAIQSRVADADAVGQRALESWISRRSRSKIEDPRLDADRHESLVFGDVKILQAIAAGFTDAARWQPAKAWADRAVAAAERQPAPIRRTLLAETQSILAEMSMRQGRAAAPDSEPRRAAVKQATALYRDVRSALPTNLAAANNLALLLALECGEAESAAALVDEIRRGSQSGRTISGDRMPLEILDTAGLVYRAAGQYDKALTLFREASRRYADEARIYQHLGACYLALARPQEAAGSFASAERLAREQAARTTDRGRKAKLEALAAAVHHELDGLPAAESSRP